jgi:acyl dehydratase
VSGDRLQGMTVHELAVGDAAEFTRVASEAHVAEFVEACGDRNPVHSDPAFAASTAFKARIAPGIWTAGLLSAVIGTRLPGPGTIYVSQDLRFVRPVKLGDAVTARVEVVELRPERNRVRLRTACRNQRGEEVLTGEAVVMPSRTPVRYEGPAPAAAVDWSAWMPAPWRWMAEATAAWAALSWAWLTPPAGGPES